MKKVLCYIGICIVLVLFSSCYRAQAFEYNRSATNEKSNQEVSIAASVNGENIYVYQLDLVVNQLSYGEMSHMEILTNTINELVVIQEAERFGISLSEDEVVQIMYSYQSMFPEIFEDAIEIFGYEGFAFGLKQRNLYTMTRDFIINNEIIPNIEISDDILLNHLRNIGMEDIDLNDETYYYVENHFINYTVEIEFVRIVNELYQSADIVYFIEN